MTSFDESTPVALDNAAAGAEVDRLLEDADVGVRLAGDVRDLLARAVQLLPYKRSARPLVTSTTVFVAAAEWAETSDAPEPILRMGEALRRSGGYAALHGEFVDGVPRPVTATDFSAALRGAIARTARVDARFPSAQLLIELLDLPPQDGTSRLMLRLKKHGIDADALLDVLQDEAVPGRGAPDDELVTIVAGKNRRRLDVTAALRRVLQLTAELMGQVSARREDLSFASLLIGLVREDRAASVLTSVVSVDRDHVIGEALTKLGLGAAGTAILDQVVEDVDGRPRDQVVERTARLVASDSAWIVIDEASRLAGPDGRLDVRHLAAAYILSDDQNHRKDIDRYRLDQELAAELYGGWLRESHPDEVDRWVAAAAQRFGTAPGAEDADTGLGGQVEDLSVDEPGLAYADFSSDAVQAPGPDGPRLLDRDRLDISSHVEAMSLLMTSTELHPPLAVGLFGDWGSGKTFFMRALRQEVDRLTARARSSGLAQHELGVFTRVVQIEFNAWHYVDADLWASLGDYIFTNLRIGGEDHGSAQKRRETFVKALREKGAALRQAEMERRRIEDQLSAAVVQHEGIRARRQADVTTLEIARAAVMADLSTKQDVEELLTQTGIPAVASEATELRDALAEARLLAARGSTTLNALRGRYGLRTMTIAAVAMLALPAVVAVLGNLDLSAASRIAGSLTAAIASAATVVRSAATGMQATLQRVAKLDEALQSQIDADPTVDDAKARVEETRAQLQKVRDREKQLQQELADLEADLEALSPERRLAEFIISRRDADDYRKHLGLASVIRRDFDELAMLIAQFNDAELSGAHDRSMEASGGSTEHMINRIVLYIDDLDRCPPQQVIKVLQAVHLLLAFPLFVVVVGVDARWLSRSLSKHYEGLLGTTEDEKTSGGESASPQDYLEKIFQIPFWLRPMSDTAKHDLLDALISLPAPTEPEQDSREPDEPDDATQPTIGRPDAAERTDQRAADPDGVATDEDHVLPEGVGQGPEDVDSPGTNGQADKIAAETSPASTEPPEDLRFTPVTISSAERSRMTQFRPLLGRSPRSLTRFVNVYRLIKAVGTRQALDEGDPDVAMFLLAVVTGRPQIASSLLDEIRRCSESDDQTLLGATDRVADAIANGNGSTGAGGDLQTVEGWLSMNPSWAAVDVSSWGPVIDDVARYSYRITHG